MFYNISVVIFLRENIRTMDNEIRKLIKKYESNMIISGRGMLFFGLWDTFKLFVSTFFSTTDRYELADILDDLDDEVRGIFIWIVLGIAGFLIISFSLYVGIKAIRYGMGTSRKKGFLIVVAVWGIANLTGIPGYFEDIKASNLDSAIASALVDLTFVSMSFDMIYSAIRLEIINRKLLKEA